MNLALLILKNLRRNKIRLFLTTMAVMILVFVLTFVLTIVLGIDQILVEGTSNVKLMVSDRFRIPSIFDRSHLDRMTSPRSKLGEELSKVPGFHGEHHAIWHFAIFTIDQDMKDPDKIFFLVATQPEKLYMTDGLENLDPEMVKKWVHQMKNPSSGTAAGIVMGKERLKKLNKSVGDVFEAKSPSHYGKPEKTSANKDGAGQRQPITMQFEIIGEIPAGHRWDQAGFMDYNHFDEVLKAQENEAAGKINMAWLRVDDQESARVTTGLIEADVRDLRVETAATAYGRFLEPFKPMFWFMKYPLTIAILVVISTILANTFSITVRERQSEIAVLKVLGFSTGKIMFLTLGEALLVGTLGGLLSATLSYLLVNKVMHGIPLGEQSDRTLMSEWVFLWGPLAGFATAFIGGIVPALHARGIQVARVFSNAA